MDVAVEVSGDPDAERLVHTLQLSGFQLVAAVEQTAAGRLATARLRSSNDRRAKGVVVDLLLASSGIEPELVGRAERLEIVPGLTVPVALAGDLIALKVLSRDDLRRARDAEDLRALLADAGAADLDLARAGLALVAARGFARGKDLPAELDRAIRELGPG